MATQAPTFIAAAAGQLRQIVSDMERLENDASHLYDSWAALGKTAMTGWSDANLWDAYAFTAATLAEAIEDLKVDHTGTVPYDMSAALAKLLKVLG
jgi:hypothetical protein